MENIKLDRIEDALEDFRQGKFVMVVDDEDRENEGDLIIAAEKITPEDVNFMLKNARGVLCVPMTLARCRELELEPQVSDNTSVLGTPFTVTVDKLEGCSTGVSIEDRCATILFPIRHRSPRHSVVRVISTPFTLRTGAFCSEPDTPKPESISPVLPDCSRWRL